MRQLVAVCCWRARAARAQLEQPVEAQAVAKLKQRLHALQVARLPVVLAAIAAAVAAPVAPPARRCRCR